MALRTILFLSLLCSVVPLFSAVCQDDEIKLSFTRSSYSVNENNGPAQPVLVLSQPVDCCSTISVWVNIKEGTAKEGEDKDFTATSPVQVLFPGGLTRVDFDVLMVDNVKLEGNKNFFVSIDPLSLPYGVVLGDHPTAEVIIVDDEKSSASFESNYVVGEGDGHVELTVTLSQEVLINNTSIGLRTVDDTTTSRCDYDGDGPYVVTIPFNVTTFKYSLPILNDDVYERDEKFKVKIAESYHSQIEIGADETTITVIDDDERIAVSFSQTTFNVNERDGNVTVELTLSRPTPCCLHLYVEVEDITAIGGNDYDDTAQYIVTFPVGTSCSSFNIPIIDDGEAEDDETFRITIVDMSLPFGTTLGGDFTAEVLIEDNDNYLNFSKTGYEIYEDVGSLCIQLTLYKPALFDTTVLINEFTGTATGGVDYEAGPYLVNINEGDMTAEFCIDIINNTRYEGDRAFIIGIDRITLPTEIVAMDPDVVLVNIREDEYITSFTELTRVVKEGDKPDEIIASVVVNFSAPLRYDTEVQFIYQDLTAFGNMSNRIESEIDYLTSYSWPNFYIVEKGAFNFTLNITIIPDNILEDNELFRITIDEPQSPEGRVRLPIDVIIMNDDDFILGFDRDNGSYAVNNKNHPDTPIVKFRDFPEGFNHSMFFPCEVIVKEGAPNDTAIGSYADNEGDYVYQNYSFIFNSTNDEFPVIIRPVDDNIVEPDEYFTLNVSIVGKADRFIIENGLVNVTIYNDDVCTVSIIEKKGRETLYFSRELSANVTVDVTHEDGTIDSTDLTAEETNSIQNDFYLSDDFSTIEIILPEGFEPYIESGDLDLDRITFIFV